jgi:HEAT repeat protein
MLLPLPRADAASGEDVIAVLPKRSIPLLRSNRADCARRSTRSEQAVQPGKDSINGLIGALAGKEAARDKAITALIELGPAAVPALKEALVNKDRQVREGAAIALGEIGPEARAAVPALAKVFGDKDAGVRLRAVCALGQIGEKSAIPFLIQFLKKDGNADVRRYAASWLGAFGPAAEEAVPALVETVKEGYNLEKSLERLDLGMPLPTTSGWIAARGLSDRAGIALVKIGAPAVPGIVTLLKGQNEDHIKDAAWILEQMGSKAKAAVPELAKHLTDEKGDVRERVAVSLGRIGPEARAALPMLAKAMKDGEWKVRVRAAAAMIQIDPKSPKAFAVLIDALKNKDKDMRESAAEALGEIGAEAEPAVPALAAALSDKEASVRTAAVYSLDSIGPRAKAAAPALAAALKDKSVGFRRMAVIALSHFRDDEGSVSALIEVLTDKCDEVRDFAVLGLIKRGKKAKAAIPALTKALEDPNQLVRKHAAIAIEIIQRKD